MRSGIKRLISLNPRNPIIKIKVTDFNGNKSTDSCK